MSDRLQNATSGKSGLGPKWGFSGWLAGRARRREYWLWVVPLLAGVMLLSGLVPGASLIFGLPLLFVWIRRLHDIGWSGWIAPLINVSIAAVGAVEIGFFHSTEGLIQGLVALAATLILGLLPGQRQANAYGSPPGRPDVAETFS